MGDTLKIIEQLIQRESRLFVCSAFVYFLHVGSPDVLAPVQESLKRALPVAVLAPWLKIAENLVSLWNLFAVIVAILLFLWAIPLGLSEKYRDKAELNWVTGVQICLGWIVRSSLWWWNLLAVQILLSLPVSLNLDLHSFFGGLRSILLVGSCPALMFWKLIEWVQGND